MNSDIPFLFIIFNRPQIAQQAFAQIKKCKPKKLYVACDGARLNIESEALLVEETKSTILKMIDWPCELKTLFQDVNLGCSMGVYSAINWLFENEETGIIIEDDCIIQETFLPFVSELLEKYKIDQRIGMIAGFNQVENIFSANSYCFSKYKACWGWATWRRAWKNMDINMKWRNTEFEKDILENTGYKGNDIKYWKHRINLIDKNRVSAWDWQWYFSLAAQNQLSVFPKVSLVSNIGFGEGATHTSGKVSKEYVANNNLAFPLVHPEYIVPNAKFEKAFYKLNNTLFYTIMRYIPFGLKNIVKKIVR